ncbi:glycoside hydrolase family 27 protein [Terrimonas sp. NA20]|uniref:Alpha-galactosidase n=1 Tax=Terrimonas ginsenosidimutans TaxID=2908004 RepID=A0ABS9KSW0_9BACT|nr:glycoside hydrolase family 27 protein [Terrimonas ginsenosidimutans]MCG2615421.1 glycoside hydrolase family 27 protein [Terrimonas ginsenosidimutans]
MRLSVFLLLFLLSGYSFSQINDRALFSLSPPMGWMTWNLYGENINEALIKRMADAMDSTGMKEAGYNYLIIDDGWQGGRDNKNNIIADPVKFPSGIKALADYVHAKGLRLGIYSDAALLTCAGYTASLNFEEQDAKVFAAWGIDYLKYDYCNAPEDSATAKSRYQRMANALSASGRDIVFGICEWGGRHPWKWAAAVGGNLWRTTGDIRDKWKALPGQSGEGIMDIVKVNGSLDKYAAPGKWNDPDMLVIGLYGAKGPSADLGGTGCTDTEYKSQMSLWCVMAAPLIATNDLTRMNTPTREILLNKEAIAINQDRLGVQAGRIENTDTWEVFLKPLKNGDLAVAILNKSGKEQQRELEFRQLGIEGEYSVRDIWTHKTAAKKNKWKGTVLPHETKLLRLIKR